MFERFSQSARTVVEQARDEAELHGDRRIGTEHFLIAVLEQTPMAQAAGVSASQARAAARELDRVALAHVGIKVVGDERLGSSALGGHARLTPGVKTVLQRALTHAVSEKARSISSRHLLLALLDRQGADPAARLLTALAVDTPALRNQLSAGS